MRRNQKRSMSPLAVGAIVLGLIVIVTYLGFTKAIPFKHHYAIKAAFRTANNIRPNSPVRIAGVNIGKVTDIKRLDGQSAVVTMQVDKKGLPIHKDATVAIRPRIFLEGNFFVDIHPGSPSAPTLGDGDTIPIQNTSAPVQLDQILTTLQSDTRHNLQTLLQEYSIALDGKGARGFRNSIPYWKPAYEGSAIVNQATLGIQAHDLSGYIKGAGTTAEALDNNPDALKSLVTDLNTTAAAFASQQGALEQTVAELPRTLRAARPALAALNSAFPPLRRLVVDLRPGVRSSGPALDASLPFIHQARLLVSKPELRGLVADLRPTVPALARLNVATVPLLQQTRALSSCQNEVVLPWSRLKIPDSTFPAKGNVFQEAPKVLTGLTSESVSGDANGQWFSTLATGGSNTYNIGTAAQPLFTQTANPLLGANPPKMERPVLRNDVPCETQQVPNLESLPGPAPPKVSTSMSAPGAQAEFDKSRTAAIDFAKQAIKTSGLADVLQVSTVDATVSEIQQLAAQATAQRQATIKRLGLHK